MSRRPGKSEIVRKGNTVTVRGPRRRRREAVQAQVNELYRQESEAHYRLRQILRRFSPQTQDEMLLEATATCAANLEAQLRREGIDLWAQA